MNAHFFRIEIISPISVWLSVRIKSFVFNRVRFFYFKKKPATHLRYGSKNMKKHMFEGKNLFVRRFLLEWKLLWHLWKRKKMGKTYTTWWTLGWGFAVVSLPLWKRNKGYKERERERPGGKCLENSWAVLAIKSSLLSLKWSLNRLSKMILYHWQVSPVINYGKLPILFFSYFPHPRPFPFSFDLLLIIASEKTARLQQHLFIWWINFKNFL